MLSLSQECGADLERAFRDFFRQLKDLAGSALLPGAKFAVVCWCAHGRHRSEATLVYILRFWKEDGGNHLPQPNAFR